LSERRNQTLEEGKAEGLQDGRKERKCRKDGRKAKKGEARKMKEGREGGDRSEHKEGR
jgi:hypothetical protein